MSSKTVTTNGQSSSGDTGKVQRAPPAHRRNFKKFLDNLRLPSNLSACSEDVHSSENVDAADEEDSEFFSLSEAEKEALNLLSVHKAAAVAVASTSYLISNLDFDDIKGYATLCRQHKELKSFMLAAEQAFLDKVIAELDHLDKVRIVFDLIDKNGSASIDTEELADAIQKARGLKKIEAVLGLAEESIRTLSGTAGGLLTLYTFEDFLESFTSIMGCTFNETICLIVSSVAFSENGRFDLEDYVADTIGSENSDDAYDRRFLEARAELVFDTMDFLQDGTASFKEVVKHLSRFTAKYLHEEVRATMLMVDTQNNRSVNLKDFTEFILNVSAAAPRQLQFHEIANAMTLSICRQDVRDDDIKDLFVSHEAYEKCLSEEDEAEVKDILSFGKLNRLFDLLDLSKDGFLDVTEIALLFRKYQPNDVNVEETIKEVLEAINAVDQNGDRKLDRKDFSILVTKLAHSSGVEIHRFVDFVLVQTVLKDDNTKDLKYLDTYRTLHKKESAGPGRFCFSAVKAKLNLISKAKAT